LGTIADATGNTRRITTTTYDAVRVLLMGAPIRIESWFPNGTPRIATVNFTFKEVVQQNGGRMTSITYIGAERHQDLGRRYKYDGNIGNTAATGSA
jgi:hypothetical protein